MRLFWILAAMLIPIGLVPSSLAQDHKDRKHPQAHENSKKHEHSASDQNHQQVLMVVGRWGPDNKTEIVGEASPVAFARINVLETDPAPFPVRGLLYLPVADLARAINGTPPPDLHIKSIEPTKVESSNPEVTPALEPGLQLEGNKLYAQKQPGKAKYEDISIKVNRDGLISSGVLKLV